MRGGGGGAVIIIMLLLAFHEYRAYSHPAIHARMLIRSRRFRFTHAHINTQSFNILLLVAYIICCAMLCYVMLALSYD